MERIAASGLAVFMVLSASACKQMTEPSGEEGPTEQPVAATEQTTEPPLTGWEPRKRTVQPSEVALVKTEDVVKEGKKGLALMQSLIDLMQGGVLPQGKECGHERVSLFPSLRLGDGMDFASVIVP